MTRHSLAELLAEAAAARPDAPAVTVDDEETTYGEVWERASALAALLRDATPTAPRRVAILAENGVDYVIAYWAVLLAGGTTVELNPGLGDAELRAQLRHAEPGLLLGDRPSLRRVGDAPGDDGGLGAVALHSDASGVAARIGAALADGRRLPGGSAAAPPADDVASIVYTSGTTGRPRGVCLTHANLAWTAGAIADSLGLGLEDPGERLLGALPLFYTYGKSVLHLATLLRAPIVFSRRLLSAPNLMRTLRGERVTHVSLVPFLADLLLGSPDFTAPQLPALRRITVAGGALPRAPRAELLRRFPGRVLPMYGLTEASTRVTCMPAAEAAERPGSCGRPLAGVEVRIAAEAGGVAARQEVGEIQVRGPNVMRGYLGDRDATQAALVDGWLRTGDLGSLDADGYLTVSGRLKDVIKVMGESVSAESIEEVIATHPGVAEVGVRGISHPRMGEAIAAFVVPRPGSSATAETIRRLCARELGRARVPSHVRFVDALPRTSSGKVRRHLLELD